MAPTIVQNTTNEVQENRPVKGVERRSDLLVRTKYTNTLPDIPFDAKFVKHPFDPNRFIQYKPTSLERSYKFEVLPEFDLGVPIDLINPDAYANDGTEISPADEALLEEEILAPKNVKRSQHHNQSVSWLRRTEYISTEQTRFQPSTMEKVEAKVGFSIKRNFKDETLYMDRSSQIKAIEKRFEDAKLPVTKHYSKPNVHAVEELPIFPDFKCWKYPCAQVIFDSDPAPVGRPIPAQIEEMSQAMIRGVMDESGEQFVAYFLPTSDTLEKRREDMIQERPYDDDAIYEYSMAREYNWNVKSKTSAGYEENYFFVARQDGMYYNELETRVRLSKRRQISSQNALTKLVVRHRPLDEAEFNMLKIRERAVEDEYIEELEETKEDEATKNGQDDEENENNEKKRSTDDVEEEEDKNREISDDDNKNDTNVVEVENNNNNNNNNDNNDNDNNDNDNNDNDDSDNNNHEGNDVNKETKEQFKIEESNNSTVEQTERSNDNDDDTDGDNKLKDKRKESNASSVSVSSSDSTSNSSSSTSGSDSSSSSSDSNSSDEE